MFQFIPSLFGLKTIAIVAAIALTIGLASGWKVRDAFCDAAASRIEVQNLQRQLKASREAATGDALKAQEDAETINALKKKASELEDQISTGECLTDADTSRVRDLWKR